MSLYFNFIDTAVLEKRISENKIPFNSFLFWDVPLENIDSNKHRRFIIERVLTRGFLEDFYMLNRIYSLQEIQGVLLQSRVLDAKTAHFCSGYFGVPLNQIHVSYYYS